MNGFMVVFLGAGLGGMLRHAVNLSAARLLGLGFPFGTLTVNIAGSLLMGVIAGYFAFRGQAPQTIRLFLTTGILGGFTTFSAFSLDAALMWERGEIAGAAMYVASSVALALTGIAAGLILMRVAFT